MNNKTKNQNICVNCEHERKEHHFCSDYPECPLLGVCRYEDCPCKKFKPKIIVESISGKDLTKDKEYLKRIKKFKPQSPET